MVQREIISILSEHNQHILKKWAEHFENVTVEPHALPYHKFQNMLVGEKWCYTMNLHE